jgi:hypothetical protein
MITLLTCVILFEPEGLVLNHWNNLHGTILNKQIVEDVS